MGKSFFLIFYFFLPLPQIPTFGELNGIFDVFYGHRSQTLFFGTKKQGDWEGGENFLWVSCMVLPRFQPPHGVFEGGFYFFSS